MLIESEITERVIGAAIEVHRAVGPGLLESVYETFLVHEFMLLGLPVQRQVEIPLEYKGCWLENGLRLDLLVDRQVIVELKAVEKILPIHEAQLLTYLKLSRIRTGLILNFNTKVLKDGIVRRVL